MSCELRGGWALISSPLHENLFLPDVPHPACGHLLPLPRAKDLVDRDFFVNAEAVAEAVQEGADNQLRRGVLAADAAHVPGAPFPR